MFTIVDKRTGEPVQSVLRNELGQYRTGRGPVRFKTRDEAEATRQRWFGVTDKVHEVRAL